MQKVCCKINLEIACFSVEACIEAENAGADRIEFCADYAKGGITPLHVDILKVKSIINIPVHVIIRPRDGSFLYSSEEIEVMKNDILFCKMNGIDAVVFGVLNSFNKIDLVINKELIELAKPMSATFHRAFDECENLDTAIIDLINLGFKRVLTSGGKKNATEGINELKALNKKFGTEIMIIPGGGVRSSTIENLMQETACREYHSAAIMDNSNFIDTKEIGRLREKIAQV